jgi:hypothetical protein
MLASRDGNDNPSSDWRPSDLDFPLCRLRIGAGRLLSAADSREFRQCPNVDQQGVAGLAACDLDEPIQCPHPRHSRGRQGDGPGGCGSVLSGRR